MEKNNDPHDWHEASDRCTICGVIRFKANLNGITRPYYLLKDGWTWSLPPCGDDIELDFVEDALKDLKDQVLEIYFDTAHPENKGLMQQQLRAWFGELQNLRKLNSVPENLQSPEKPII